MRISIIGPGAVGTLIGGLLSLLGHEVAFRGRSASVSPARNIRIVLPSGWLLASGLTEAAAEADAAAEAGAAGFSVVALARHHLHAIRRPDFARLVPGNAPLVFLNQDPSEVERLGLPRERTSLCITLMNAVQLQAGEVELTTEKPFVVVERPSGMQTHFRDLSQFGFNVLAVDDIGPWHNSFFLYQMLFLPVAMCNTTLEMFLSYPEGREIAQSLLGEGFAAMEKTGRKLARMPVMDPGDLAARLARRPSDFNQARDRPDRSYNTVLQSFLRGRPTEAGMLNRKVVELASTTGLHLTLNWRLLQKIGRVASVGFYRDPAELRESLA